jgi:class 3 adenylate cyclase
MRTQVPDDRAERVAALHKYGILDSAPEVIYDEITRLAAQICECPVATIGMVDEQRHWAKARYGLPPDEKPKELSICTTTINQSDLLTIPDLAADDRFASLPNVAGKPHFRFYCGVPLINSEGHALGTICVMDFEPRILNFEQTEALRCLSHQVMAQLELRRNLIELDQAHRELESANQLIEDKKAQSDRLLLNILPASVADELKRNGQVEPKFFNSATILFADFVGFTKLADGMEPIQLIQQLDEYFSVFDQIAGESGLTKLKTIGDAYMAVGGVPETNRTHAADACLAAIRMRDYMAEVNQKRLVMHLEPWNLRIGLHTGPLIAGVVGRKSFSYDVWGDSVNVAARIEAGGSEGQITISEYTRNLVENLFELAPAGEIEAKNKGVLRVYRLQNLKSE